MFKKSPPSLSTVTGIGVDLINQQRIAAVLERHPELFPKKILHDLELTDYPIVFEKQVNYLAKRFAAKEAFSKALGTGIGQALSFKDLAVVKDNLGKPFFKLSERLKANYPNLEAFLSLADDNPNVIAFCIISSSLP